MHKIYEYSMEYHNRLYSPDFSHDDRKYIIFVILSYSLFRNFVINRFHCFDLYIIRHKDTDFSIYTLSVVHNQYYSDISNKYNS